ncbi:MAG: sigma-54-dependent Fis family transcriptional regulator, partial [Polyangiaceae bacterium]|nr:sigma-54-dependent Fis family transcriptional regulator [Polyangiaceae bacterium]
MKPVTDPHPDCFSSLTTQPEAFDSSAEEPPAQPVIRWVHPGAATTRPGTRAQVLGRDPACAQQLSGHEVSRRHAEVEIDGPVVVIRDLESRNGVYVNGRKVTQARLSDGDVVRLGEWVGIVVRLGAGDDPSWRSLASGLLGSHRLAAVLQPVQRVAATALPVVIQGETGTGKEGVARALHEWSGRPGRFVAVNCAAIAPSLAEGELFGYRKGAFTGADRAGVGYLRAAHRGTLFLDEVLELPAPLQAKLLRVLEEQEVHPLGELEPVPIDIRLVAAAQEPLTRAASAGLFRPDLMARLDGLTIEVPPLRARKEDVAALFQSFLQDHSGQAAPGVEPHLV